jgi:transglutaminase-like putative cysteine protease
MVRVIILLAFLVVKITVVALSPSVLYGKTLILEGSLKSKIRVTQQMEFEIKAPLNKLSFRFALPRDFSNSFVSQKIQDLNINVDPKPYRLDRETDRFGNQWAIATWQELSVSPKVTITFEVSIGSELKAENSTAGFPLSNIPEPEKVFLKSSKEVQADNPEIVRLARTLTKDAVTEYEAVTRILNYVADHVKYTYNPPQYDALYTLKTGTGNCQNFAHFSMALLRAAGIPSRIVGGITLKEPWKIPLNEKDYLVQSMGQGGHAWIEIYFPDLGWLSYDPQQSRQFTSSRHIKQTHGLDSNDINDSWRASPYLPEYNELIDGRFLSDELRLAPPLGTEKAPRTYILSNRLISKMEPPESKKPEVEEKPVPLLPEGKTFEFGNMVFPNLVELYQVSGDRAVKVLDKETAEYVTSRYVYAQAFMIDEDINIEKVSLAMRKFGGDGTVYIDLVNDEGGRPGLKGFRSLPIFIEDIPRRPGYYWLDFAFPEKVRLLKGRYWIVLRHSGEVIMNWFYIPGNPYGDADDTRSTLKGYRWEDIQNFDFVFKIRATR